MMSVICLYHAQCVDGAASAAIVRGRHPFAQFIPVKYGTPVPWDLMNLNKKCVVYIVDFSYPIWMLNEIASKCREVVVLDHHASFIDSLAKAEVQLAPNLICRTSSTESGAILTYRYLYPHTDIPSIIQAISARDTWNLSDISTNYIHAYITQYPVTPARLEKVLSMRYAEIANAGRPLWSALVAKWKVLIAELAFSSSWLGYKDIPTINVHPSQGNSDILHILNNGKPFAVSYYTTGTRTKLSFRSRKDQLQSLNVAKLLEPHGGGGHKHAAGITVPNTEIGKLKS